MKYTIISSQRYIDYDIVIAKMDELAGVERITLRVYETGLTDDEGHSLYILFDGHHRKEAAEALGLEIVYEAETHPEGLKYEKLLTDQYNDSDWYYVETGCNVW